MMQLFQNSSKVSWPPKPVKLHDSVINIQGKTKCFSLNSLVAGNTLIVLRRRRKSECPMMNISRHNEDSVPQKMKKTKKEFSVSNMVETIIKPLFFHVNWVPLFRQIDKL